jgi:hypothetical protein
MISPAKTARRLSPAPFLATAAALVGAFGFATSARSQDFNAMLAQQNAYLEQQIQASQAQMNAQINAGQQRVQQIVQQKMQDPQVQAAYQQHLAQASQRGVQPYDFPTFAYYYAATNGFSSSGVAAYNQTSQDIQGRERAAWQGVRDAEAQRGQAINGLNDGYSRNQQEAGRQLMGNSTYVNAATGQSQALPHTWQANTYNNYQGNTYYVDQSGQYWMADPNGSGNWMQMAPGR